ncbi:MAG: urease accessory protein UreG, partial [Acetobacteraceae bacterium]
TKSDLLVVNKTDLAPHVGVDPVLLEADTARSRGQRPYVMAQLRHGKGVDAVVDFIVKHGGLRLKTDAA